SKEGEKFTNQSAKPMLKQIINHDTERGVITCHSLNESPEYADFKLNIDDVIKLFYVIDKSRNISKKSYY
ncbi:MAG TPA: hypothetical protein DCF46_11775, partial [Porphyromonadaceae bacterium]|nr:hypothetical protein [Porphyromonadaceae bacterium]HBF95562.1 hypothetical protein [Porphyromonadaceae bacterium]